METLEKICVGKWDFSHMREYEAITGILISNFKGL